MWSQGCRARGPALHAYTSNLGILKHGDATFGLSQSKFASQRTVCKDHKEAGIRTTAPMTTELKI